MNFNFSQNPGQGQAPTLLLFHEGDRQLLGSIPISTSHPWGSQEERDPSQVEIGINVLSALTDTGLLKTLPAEALSSPDTQRGAAHTSQFKRKSLWMLHC